MRSTFLCQFKKVSIYPFGTEECWFQFYLKQNSETKVKAAIHVENKAADVIGQYEVHQWALYDVENTGGSHIQYFFHTNFFQCLSSTKLYLLSIRSPCMR